MSALATRRDPTIPVILNEKVTVEVVPVLSVPAIGQTEGASNKVAFAFRIVGCHDDSFSVCCSQIKSSS